ncbi:mCG1040446 [Mus musculus]|nr:mCG1040446 [Mus musculus]
MQTRGRLQRHAWPRIILKPHEDLFWGHRRQMFMIHCYMKEVVYTISTFG